MRKKIVAGCICIIIFINFGYAQTSDTAIKDLDEVIVAYNKWEQNRKEVPNKILKLDNKETRLRNPQTTADLLAMSGAVFVQKSQLGGGSPMIRGFATNRILIVNDGVRMNNAIYRSGNLQNIIQIDPFSVENAEVIFGPGSLIYGSDAIGGVMDFHTLQVRYSDSKKAVIKGSVVARYSTANKEKTIHADINAGFKKFALLTSFTYSKYDDLLMGKNGGQDGYLRSEYVERINNVDSILSNSNARVQKFSGYDQVNFLQKIKYKAGEYLDLQYSFTYGGTGNAPRYDRLIQKRQGKLRFAEWSYGPMILRMHTLQAEHKRKTVLYDEARFITAYQDYNESRIDRTRGNNNRNTQSENVHAYSFNWDALKNIGDGQLFYGVEQVFNKVGSSGSRRNISTDVVSNYVSRYPDGSTWSTTGIYASYKQNISKQLTATGGVRYSYNTLNANFDTLFVKFPYQKAVLRDGALTGNLGLVYRPSDGWQLNAVFSTGYRMPNVDDIGKFFESVPGNITVPNPDLKSEYAWNWEIGIIKRISKKLTIELNLFHTILDNAIVRRPFTLNGQDSIDFDGITSRVEALQNVAKATVWGVQSSVEWQFARNFTFQSNANWISGKETDDSKNEQVALRHAPPFYGNSLIRYYRNKFRIEFSAFYNGKIENEKLAPSEQAKTDIYAKDDAGKPYSPSWYTFNLKAGYDLNKFLNISTGWENITNQRYRPYSSGIVAAGSNFIIALRSNL